MIISGLIGTVIGKCVIEDVLEDVGLGTAMSDLVDISYAPGLIYHDGVKIVHENRTRIVGALICKRPSDTCVQDATIIEYFDDGREKVYKEPVICLRTYLIEDYNVVDRVERKRGKYNK